MAQSNKRRGGGGKIIIVEKKKRMNDDIYNVYDEMIITIPIPKRKKCLLINNNYEDDIELVLFSKNLIQTVTS